MRWDDYKPGWKSHNDTPEHVRGGGSPEERRAPPEPSTWEAHRRHRTFDERGIPESETHEAIRVRFQKRRGKKSQLPEPEYAEPPVPVTVLIAATLHGAIWWATMGTLAFTDSGWFTLVWIPIIGFLLGWKFLLIQALVVWAGGGLMLAFDGWVGWAVVLPIAGLLAPGRWIRGEW